MENERPATPRGLEDATTERDAVATIWRGYPCTLIGIPTGVRSDFDVLEVDVRHDAARAWLVAAKDRIPATRTYQTRSGGFHFLFRHAAGMRSGDGVVVKGVNIRGDGEYVAFWFAAGFPCTDHSPIANWPDWLLEVLRAAGEGVARD